MKNEETKSVTANQVEKGDTQSASISVPTTITANQYEKGDTQSATISVVVTITANQYEEGDTQSASITVEQAVKIESSIPPDAKKAVKKFIEDQISQLNEAVGDFIIGIPDELVQYVEAMLRIIGQLTGWGQ